MIAPAGLLAAAFDLDQIAFRVVLAGTDPQRPPLLAEAQAEAERAKSHGILPCGRAIAGARPIAE